MTINDCRNTRTAGNALSFLNGAEGTAASMNAAWEWYLQEAGVTEGSLNDRQVSYLRGLGYTGTLSDMLAAWWCDEGEDVLPPVNTSSASIVPAALSVGAEAQVDEGTWDSIESVTFSYQWQLDGVDIIGATSKALLILAGMVGQALRCVVRCINSAGFAISITTAVVITL